MSFATKMFKLIFSPEICPIIQHTRPVGWLHDMFYYSLGWASWSVGIRRSYESPLARAVAEQKYTNGIRGSESCDGEYREIFFFRRRKFIFVSDFFLLIFMNFFSLVSSTKIFFITSTRARRCLFLFYVWSGLYAPGEFLLCTLALPFKADTANKEIMAPLILLMFVLHPLRHLIKSIIGIAFSLVYYSTDITIYFIEKLMSSINWAGKRGAWIVVSALPILVCTIVGYSIFSSKFQLPALLFTLPVLQTPPLKKIGSTMLSLFQIT